VRQLHGRVAEIDVGQSVVQAGAVAELKPGDLAAATLTAMEIQLRDVTESDFPILFEHQCDPVSVRMAAFGTKDSDRDALAARWEKSLSDESTTQKAILVDHTVVGFVASFMREGQLEVTYWIARTHWGRGIATAALSQLL
jgi:RimJ/RimL family protein N-acetyltransferase